jgi:hypothetical protein
LDIIGIAETHLLRNNTLSVPGYSWYGGNRTNIHVRSKKGSGGVGVLIKHVLNALYVSVLDDTQEDSLCVNLRHKVTGEQIRVCVCYL